MSELRSCVKVEVAVLGSHPYGFCGRKATLQIIERVEYILSSTVRFSQMCQVVISYDIRHPSALAIIEDQLIWSEKKMGGIMAANKFTGKDRHRILVHSSRVTGAAVLHPALQPSG